MTNSQRPANSCGSFLAKVFIYRFFSEHTLRELQEAPESVGARLLDIPEPHQIVLVDTPEADALAEAFSLTRHRWSREVSECPARSTGQRYVEWMSSGPVRISSILSILAESDCLTPSF